MTPVVAIVLLAIGVLAWLIAAPLWRARRRAARMARPLAGRAPPRPSTATCRRCATCRPSCAARLESLMSAFLAEKEFIGCNGLVVTDEIRATIAALACLLVLGRRGHYDALHSMLVYPDAPSGSRTKSRTRPASSRSAGACCPARPGIRAASSSRGRTCSRPRARPARATTSRCTSSRTTSTPREAVGLSAAGEPPASSSSTGPTTSPSSSTSLLDAVDRGEYTFLDPYAAEDEAEFFAVATEDFFERPVELRAAHPRLYAAAAGVLRARSRGVGRRGVPSCRRRWP